MISQIGDGYRDMNKDLYTRIVDAYNASKISIQRKHKLGSNEDFFRMQRELYESGEQFPALTKSKYYPVLRALIADRVVAFLKKIGQQRKVGKPFDLFIWAAVQENNVAHKPHIHKDSLVSGVFYINVPEECNCAITFNDPRGALPPFDQNSFVHQPKNGEFILFPGWLVHSTGSPSHDDAQGLRVAISFNVMGSWITTSDISMGSSF
eukprot:g1597.t1